VLRDARHQLGEAGALERIGELSLRRGQVTQAADFFEQALAIYRRIENRGGVADVLGSLGEVRLRQSEYEQAIGYLRQALALHRQTGYQHGETVTLRSLAGALHEAGQPAAARAELETALRLAAETGNTYQQATVQRDLADSHHCAGQDQRAATTGSRHSPYIPSSANPRQTRSGPGSAPRRHSRPDHRPARLRPSTAAALRDRVNGRDDVWLFRPGEPLEDQARPVRIGR
jgi:tetratricopeptide (TPR) repeat protein